jgi:hypothetical protein
VEDVARVPPRLANPPPLGKIDHLTGPQSENMYLSALQR